MIERSPTSIANRMSFSPAGDSKRLSHSNDDRIVRVSKKSLISNQEESTHGSIKIIPGLPPLKVDLEFEKEDSTSYLTSQTENSQLLDNPKARAPHDYEIRIPTNLLPLVLSKMREIMRVISLGTQLSYIKGTTYKDIQEKLSLLKSDIYQISNYFESLTQHELRQKRYRLVPIAKTLIIEIDALRKLINQKLRLPLNESTKYDLIDLKKELGTLKMQYLKPLTIP